MDAAVNDEKIGILVIPKDAPVYDDVLIENLKKFPTSNCTRCKKDFAQLGPKPFKRCNHCRELQRLRTKRWQIETRQKEGACSRCRTVLSDTTFSLCPKCRGYLRINKETRLLKGKCVHCSAPNEECDVYKVCKKCRTKDRTRRLTLEQEGLCIRCTTPLSKDGSDKKLCFSCKLKKRAFSASNNTKIDNEMCPSEILSLAANLNTARKHDLHNEHEEQTAKRKSFETSPIDSRKDGYDSENHNNSTNMPVYDEQSLEDKILENFVLHHDHAQLNQQLKRLTQYTSDNGNNSMDVDVSKYTDDPSDLVDLNGLDDIDINYSIENVEDEDEVLNNNEGSHTNDDARDNINDNRTEDEDNNSRSYSNNKQAVDLNKDISAQNGVDDDAEKESILMHVRAVQAGLLSNDSEPSEAEIVAAVEAVAAAAAAVVASNRIDD